MTANAGDNKIPRDQEIELVIAVENRLFALLCESLPYCKQCKPITNRKELERRFCCIQMAGLLVAAAARAGVHNCLTGIPYSQKIADATNFVRTVENYFDHWEPCSDD